MSLFYKHLYVLFLALFLHLNTNASDSIISVQRLEDRVIVIMDDSVNYVYYEGDSIYHFYKQLPDSLFLTDSVSLAKRRQVEEETRRKIQREVEEAIKLKEKDDKAGFWIFIFMLLSFMLYLKFGPAIVPPGQTSNYFLSKRFSVKRNTKSRLRIHGATSWFLFASTYDQVLSTYYSFYRTLQPEKKKVFIQRVKEFIEAREFAGRKGMEVTKEMKIIIAAVAVQVTFGFRNFLMENFRTIIVYPDEYLSNATQQMHKGETNAYGVIVFSWKDFIFGLQHATDNLNLGFHEFGHVLLMSERAYKNNPGFLFYYKYWREHSNDAAIRRKIDDNHLFRKYANENEHEFFAIALENFFETPERFQKELPELYKTLTLMLNQDPLTPAILLNEYDEYELIEL